MTPSSLFLTITFAALLAGCDVRPKNVPCSNAGDCEAAGDQFRYCLESRCVECLGDSSCGEGNKCTSGRCERRCRDGRDCVKGETCHDGRCDR